MTLFNEEVERIEFILYWNKLCIVILLWNIDTKNKENYLKGYCIKKVNVNFEKKIKSLLSDFKVSQLKLLLSNLLFIIY